MGASDGTSAGGTTAGAGSGGSGATGGAGGAGGYANPEANLPRCLADLVAPCTCNGVGECGPQTCFVPGVTTMTTSPDGGACNFAGDADETRVLKPDGSLCYSVRSSAYMGAACEIITLSWHDPMGQEVASASGYPSHLSSCGFHQTPTVTCKATGETGAAPWPSWPHSDCSSGCL